MKLVWNYDSVIINFIADLVFFFIMVLIYKNNIKDGYFKFKEKYSLKPKVLFILKWVGVLLLINVIGGIITETFLPGLGIDDNTKMIIDLFDVSFIYFIFKILIFSTIAEEALFKKAVRDVIPNNTLFIIVSSLIYSIMNIVYTEFGIISIIDDDSIIVISGLGTNTILKILTDSKNKLPKTLIIQSNNEIPK
ncbi:MAG: SAM-dependent methyltransferase, partial [Mollicutes bacterium]|nr:SAM-dependent methyltransferase [Mollicutes bacterium]